MPMSPASDPSTGSGLLWTGTSAGRAPALAHHDARRGAGPALVGGELLPHPAGDVLVGLGVRAVGFGYDDGMPTVGRGADVEMQRDLAQERDAEFVGLLARAAMAEDFRALAAMGAEEVAHVLDDAEHRHGDLAEHAQSLARIDQGDVLRRRDDHRAGQRHA